MSDIRARRNSLLKSSISINSIRTSVSKFTKGLVNSRETASQIVKRTRENNIFKQKSISNDNLFFRKRQENVRRKQREDELEASGITGVIKRQGNVIAQSTKGFLGRILDFFGIILIGWFVNTLPGILKSLEKLINRIRKVINFLTGIVDNVRDFLIGLGGGISNALQKLPKMDFLAMSNRNRENLEKANNNLLRVSNDLIDVGRDYSGGGLAVGLERADGDYTIVSGDDEEKKKEAQKTKVEVIPSDSVDGKPKEEEKQFTSPTTSLALNNKSNDSDDKLIQGLQNESVYNDIKSAQSREKGETIDNKNLDNQKEKDQNKDGESLISSLKIRAEKFFGNMAQQQTEKLNVETEQKKDDSSIVAGFFANIKKNVPETEQVDKKVTPRKRERNVTGRKKSKRNQVIIMEKAVAMNDTSMSMSGGGSGSKGLNNLGEFNFDNEKKITKKFQSVILNT